MFGFHNQTRKSICVVIASYRSSESLQAFVADCSRLPGKPVILCDPTESMEVRDADVVVVADDRANISDLRRMTEPILAGHSDAVIICGKQWPKPDGCLSPLPVWSRLINECADRPELSHAALMYLPFAMTREAWHEFGGIRILEHPAMAHVRLIRSQLSISVYAGHCKEIADRSTSGLSAIWTSTALGGVEPHSVISQLHEAFVSLHSRARGGWTDGGRRRDIVERLVEDSLSLPPVNRGIDFSSHNYLENRRTLSVVIPVRNEEATIGRVIREAKQLAPSEIIIVVNGSSDHTERIARAHGAATIVFPEPLGTDVGRAIGAYAAQGDILLFLDGDFVIPWKDLCPFLDFVSTRCDVAVNKLNHHLGMRFPPGTVTALKYALNTALNREDLENASLVNVPFAMNRRALEVIHWTRLLCPPKAYATGLLSGLTFMPAHGIEVDRLNRYRPSKHSSAGGKYSPAAMQIIGDHIEAMQAILDIKGGK